MTHNSDSVTTEDSSGKRRDELPALVRSLLLEAVKINATDIDEEREMFQAEGLDVPSCIPRARGCEKCHNMGYSGRTGVFQVVALDHKMVSAVSGTGGTDALRKIIRERNIPSLRHDALSKVAAVITTIEEVQNLHSQGELKWLSE